MKNKVLVLMATYNGEKFIEQQILSIINQINCDVSILISDDGSNDKTLNIINNLKKTRNIDIKVLSNPLRSNSFSLNFLNLFINANVQNYDFIALSDQDDIFLHDKFIESINIIREKNMSGLSSAVETFGDSNKILRQSPRVTKFDFLFEGAGQGCTFLMKSKDFLLFKKFCINNFEYIKNFYYHDWLIYLFFRTKDMGWFFYEKPFTKYRIHSKNNTGSKYTVTGFLKRLLKIFNGWYLNQIIYAINIHNKINVESNQIKINFFNLFILITFHGRRKLSDRFLSIFCLLSYFLARKL